MIKKFIQTLKDLTPKYTCPECGEVYSIWHERMFHRHFKHEIPIEELQGEIFPDK